jgi:hypothetical protein
VSGGIARARAGAALRRIGGELRVPLISLIDNERVGIDVGVWFFKLQSPGSTKNDTTILR